MIISSNSENKEIEKRIAITPEITKKYINLGFEVQLIKNYGTTNSRRYLQQSVS